MSPYVCDCTNVVYMFCVYCIYNYLNKFEARSLFSTSYLIKTVKHPKSVMVWGDFCGDNGREGLYFFPKNVTMRGDSYLRVLDHHILPFWDIR